jgi:Tol biopolymer transport system component
MRSRASLEFVVFLSLASPTLAGGGAPPRSTSLVGPLGLGFNAQPEVISISQSGRYVAFTSSAPDLVPHDGNGRNDVFWMDLETRRTVRVSVATSGAEGNDRSDFPSISADGRFVAFESLATNLVEGATNGSCANSPPCSDVFVNDVESGATICLSESIDDDAFDPAISADGRIVAFASAGYAGSSSAVWAVDRDLDGDGVYDDSAPVLERADVGRPNGMGARLSGDGRFVAFLSSDEVFVRDRLAQVTEMVPGAVAFAPSLDVYWFDVSADGRFVAFATGDPLVPGDVDDVVDVYVFDRVALSTDWISPHGFEPHDSGSRDSVHPAISADGRFVTFHSYARTLVPSDGNDEPDVFVTDRQTGVVERASVSSSGQEGAPPGASFSPSISGDGRFVAFASGAELVPGAATGGYFLRDLVSDADLACRAGNVGAGAGPTVDVLFVNGSAGAGLERVVELAPTDPLVIRMELPPSRAGRLAPFALYLWLGDPTPFSTWSLPLGLGTSCRAMPATPLAGGQPLIVWNNARHTSFLGVATRSSSPAPSDVVSIPRGIGRPLRATLQGIIVDDGAPNGRAAVTNAVIVSAR